jgi:PKD repeat protein
MLALVSALVLAGASAGAPTPAHVHFTAAGDYAASATTTTGVLNALAAGGSDAHLALGDMSYSTTGQENAWCNFVKARLGEKFPFELVSGNHESNGQNGNINDFSACLPNQLPGVVGTYGRQYYVDVPQENPLVRFVMISPNLPFSDGTWNYPAGSARYDWTSAAIDGARTADIPWVVVGMHKPCFSLGEYACDIGADLANLLVSKKVDLVLSGHEHLYQRTKQLGLRAGCATLTIGSYNPSCVVDSDNSLTKGAGTVFATIGTGGINQRDVNAADPEAGYFVASAGSNQNQTYGFGDFDATPDALTMRFVRGSGGNFTDAFTITRDTSPPANQDPVAAFTTQTTGRSAVFDGTGSSDPDGTIASWSWNFGDGGTGTGDKPSHDYAADGVFPVTLTVTDNQGATASVTHDVSVSTAPPATTVAKDLFERTVANAWGSAEVGGAWTLRGTASKFKVAGGAGQIQVAAGSTLYADLNSVSQTGVRLDADFSVDNISGDTYLSFIGRQVGTEYYVAKLRLQANGKGLFYLFRSAGNLIGAPVYTPSLVFQPGVQYRVSLLVKGTSPTTVSAKVWKASDPEPGWQMNTTDNFAALQTAGRVGLVAYVSAGATPSPVNVSYHQFVATAAN